MYLRAIGRALLAILLLPIRLLRAVFFVLHALAYALCRLLGSRAARWVWFLGLLAWFTQLEWVIEPGYRYGSVPRLSLEHFVTLMLVGIGVSVVAARLRGLIGRPVLPRRMPRVRRRKSETIQPSHVQAIVPPLPRFPKSCDWAPVLEGLAGEAAQRQAKQIAA